MILEWVFCFIYTCTENVRSIFDDIRRLDWYEVLRCGTVQIVPNCLPDVYFIIYLMFTLSSHYITLPRSYSIIEHVTWSRLMSCDDHVTHREDLSYSNNVLDDRWTNETKKIATSRPPELMLVTISRIFVINISYPTFVNNIDVEKKVRLV